MIADLHIHTNFSRDGQSSPKEIINSAILKGLKCVCITDHGTIKGAINAMKFAFDKNILVVPGIEILSKSGDILGINIKRKIPNGLSVRETIKRIRKNGGIAVIPHPFDKPFTGFWGGKKSINDARPDAIEVFNASVFFNSSNKIALDFSREKNLCFTAGSDAHKKEFVGRGYIEIEDNIFSEEDVISAIMKRKAKVGGDILNSLEVFKNATKTDFRATLKYLRNRLLG